MTTSSEPRVSSIVPLREDAVGTYAAALDEATGEPVGVRRLHAHLAGDAAARQLFAEESRRIATLAAPYLLRVLRADPRADLPWIVTEPIDGTTLEAEVARAPWPEPHARALVVALTRAFFVLETRRQFHAAPVPSRLRRVGEGWRLLTFRDVRAEDEALRLQGRPPPDERFAPPEVTARGGAPTRARPMAAWSLGALWTYLVTGLPPGQGAWQPTPAGDREALARLLASDPARRPQDMTAVLALLGEAPSAPTPSASRSWRQRPT